MPSPSKSQAAEPGVFAYDGGTVSLSDCTVTVTGGSAGGVQVAGGGTLTGSNLTVTSASKAAIRSDRGGVHVVLDEASTWTLTADSYISSFEGDLGCVIRNGHTLYVNGTAVN